MLEFAAQPSSSLPSFISPFSNPVRIGHGSFDTGTDEIFGGILEEIELQAAAPILGMPSAAESPSDLRPSAS